MLRVVRLYLENWKGLTEHVSLAPLTLIVGPNGSGKSAILEALQFAVEGQTSLGAKPEATAQLGGTTGCMVVCTLEDGFGWQRTLTVNRREGGKVTSSMLVNTKPIGVKAGSGQVAKHVGSFAPMFDLSRFLGLSPDKMRDFVLELCGQAGGAGDSGGMANRIFLAFCVETLGSAHVNALADTETMAEGFDALGGALSGPDLECLKVAIAELGRDYRPGADTASILLASLNTSRELMNAAKRQKDEAIAASRRFSAQKTAVVVVAGTVANLEEKKAALDEEVGDIRDQLANQAGRASTLKALQADVAKAKTAYETATVAQTIAKGVVWPADDPDQLEKQAHALGEDQPDPTRFDHLFEVRTKTARYAEDAQATTNTLTDRVGILRQQLEMKESRIKAIKGNPVLRLYNLLVAFSAEWLSESSPPEDTDRPQRDSDWGEILGIVVAQLQPCALAELEASHADIAKQVASIEKALAVTVERRDKTTAEYETARKAAEDALAQQDADRTRHAEITTKVAELDRRAGDIRDEIDGYNRAIATAKAETARCEKWQLETQGRLDALMAEGGFIPDEELTTQRSALTTQIAVLTTQIEQKLKYKTLDDELKKAVAAAERETVMYDVCQRLGNAIRTLREQIMEEMVKPLLDRMNKFLALAVPDRAAYCRLITDRGSPTFELGWLIDGSVRRPYVSMSGGEQAVFGCALAYALVCLADPPLKLLMIEAAEIDESHLYRIVAAINGLCGDLSNVLIATHLDAPFLGTGDDWTLIQRALPEPALA